MLNWVTWLQTARRLRASYWFLPSLMMIAAIALSRLTGAIDHRIGPEWLSSSGFLLDSRPDGARAVLSAIAGSMITVAGVTFSTTMVSVSFAAGHFGPRLIGNFMRDRANQLTLGVFTSTFVYCLMVLRSVRSAESGSGPDAATAFVPHLSLLVALALALCCVAVLVFFFHHVPEMINVGRITADLGHQLIDDLASIFPESAEEDRDAEGPRNASHGEFFLGAEDGRAPDGTRLLAIRSTLDGYIQAVDLDALTDCAVENDFRIRLEYRPGDFASRGEVLAYALSRREVPDEVLERIRCQFAFGRERTSAQNVIYLADQLIEIMARALSPGVNDPYTALDCIHWLGSALMKAAEHPEAASHRIDEDGEVRVLVHPVHFERFAEVIFDRSRQYVSSDRNASLALMKAATEATLRAREPERRQILLRHAEILCQAAQERLPLEVDRREIARRLASLRAMLVDPVLTQRFRDSQGWVGGSA